LYSVTFKLLHVSAFTQLGHHQVVHLKLRQLSLNYLPQTANITENRWQIV